MSGAGRGVAAAPHRFRTPAGAFAACACALAVLLSRGVARPASGAAVAGEAGPEVSRALSAVAEIRRRVDPAAAASEDTWLALALRGRPALEIKGRVAGSGVHASCVNSAPFRPSTS